MATDCKNIDGLIIKSINQPVFLGKPFGPQPGQIVFQSLRFPKP